MRHRKTVKKLGRKAEHRDAMLANQVCSLIKHERIKTTLAKAKATRILAEKMVTLGKDGSLHSRRLAIAALQQQDAVKKLFEQIAPRSANRSGGYTRIIKLGPRLSDAAPMAYLEWVDQADASVETAEPEAKASKSKPSGKTPAKPKKETKPEAKSEAPAEAKTEEAEARVEKPSPEPGPETPEAGNPEAAAAAEPAPESEEATDEKPKVLPTPGSRKKSEEGD